MTKKAGKRAVTIPFCPHKYEIINIPLLYGEKTTLLHNYNNGIKHKSHSWCIIVGFKYKFCCYTCYAVLYIYIVTGYEILIYV